MLFRSDQHHAHLLFEMFDAGREGRLRDPARLRGAAEMPLAGQSKKEFKFIDQCVSFRPAVPQLPWPKPSSDRDYRLIDGN